MFETEKMLIYDVNEKHLLKTDFKVLVQEY